MLPIERSFEASARSRGRIYGLHLVRTVCYGSLSSLIRRRGQPSEELRLLLAAASLAWRSPSLSLVGGHLKLNKLSCKLADLYRSAKRGSKMRAIQAASGPRASGSVWLNRFGCDYDSNMAVLIKTISGSVLLLLFAVVDPVSL